MDRDYSEKFSGLFSLALLYMHINPLLLSLSLFLSLTVTYDITHTLDRHLLQQALDFCRTTERKMSKMVLFQV